ncbi:MAG TPA: PKD domain-containing protein [Bacteroidia bacterium]|jgi:gliding motility-associated-like protein
MAFTVKKYFLLVLLCAPMFSAFSHNGKSNESQSAIKFTENKNQWDKKVIYRAQLDGGLLFLENNAFTYNFYDKETLRNNHTGRNKAKSGEPIRSHAFRMTFMNSLPGVEVSSSQVTPDYCNFYIGKDKKRWAGSAQNFREVNYKELYDGIGLQLLGLQNSIKYNLIVSPQANTNQIAFLYEGLEKLTLEKGALLLKTSVNEMTEQKPYAYQYIDGFEVEVPCEFVLKNNTVTFRFPKGYNKEVELIIDPILVFACSSGSTADNFGMTATYDAQGNLYSGGTCFDVGFPTTLGAYDVTFNGGTAYGRTDVVITKYDSSGTFLQYSTYIGGALSTEIVTSLVVDNSNNLLLYGATGSTDFPVTPTAYDTTFNGGILLRFVYNGSYFDNGTDIYVAKLNSTGTTLMASTFIGGSLNDGVNVNNDSVLFSAGPPAVYEFPSDSLQYNYGDQFRGEINVDAVGNAYIASSTRSGNFPIAGGFDNTLGGEQDAVAFKFNSDLSVLVWSTFLGGTDNDAGYALALDDSANVYVTGGTRSINFPTTAGVLRTTYQGGKADGYISRIKKDGTALLSSTFWGTASYDQSYFIQFDKDSNVYVVGQTEGLMPVTAGVYNNPNSGQFISRMNYTLTSLGFSTVFGNGSGTPNISPSAFLVDECKNIYVSGWGGKIVPPVTTTTGMPITPGAIQPTTDGHNFYLIVLSANASALFYATYFGGASSWEHVDGGTSRFDKKGIIYQSVCAGCGGNDDFPVTAGSWPNTGANVNHATNCNNGTFKFDFQVPPVDADFGVDSTSGCAPFSVTFNNQSSPFGTYLWDFGGGDTTSLIYNPTHVYNTPGTYLVTLILNNSACKISDTAFSYITVYPGITADFGISSPPCSNTISLSDSSATAPASWQWNFGDSGTSTLQNPTHTYPSSGSYVVTLIATTVNGCADTTAINFDNSGGATVNASTTICDGGEAQLSATGGFAYSWTPASSLNNAAISNPVASPAVTTTYTVNISTVNSLGDTCITTLTTTVNVLNPALFPLSATADSDSIFEGSSTIIHAITDTTLTILWSPSTGLSNPNSFNPIATPTTTTTYTLTVIDSSGCPKVATITIYVLSTKCNPADVFVPNTFTPNADGQNDILFVRGNMITELYFAVYNRWGELVFETKDQSIGWDGIYKGMKADPAVFAWYLRAKCYNGEELKKQGNTTLIR